MPTEDLGKNDLTVMGFRSVVRRMFDWEPATESAAWLH